MLILTGTIGMNAHTDSRYSFRTPSFIAVIVKSTMTTLR